MSCSRGSFAYFLPQIADYRDVWGVVKELSWEWLVVLSAATILNLLTFAPPWMVALPGLKFRSALAMTQVSTALSIVLRPGQPSESPGRMASSAVGASRAARSRVPSRSSAWNQFANLSYPVIAVALLSVTGGGDSPVLVTAAIIGVRPW